LFLRHPLLAYVLLAYGWTWVTALPLIASNRGWIGSAIPPAFEAVGAFGPFVAAWLVLRATAGTAGTAELRAGLLRWQVGAGWLTFTVLSPVAFLLLAALSMTFVQGTAPDLSAIGRGELGTLHGVLDLVIVAALLQGLGEEPGWRGFFLPQLRERFGPLAATLVLFPVWLFWHLPFFLARPEFGLAQFGGFALGIVSAAIWLTLLWDATGSSLVAVAWHALLNITRGIALAISTPLFLAYGAVVMLGALVIVGYWTLRRVRNRDNG
jgi:membrane protease YdiL (CAAX protease family)